MLVVDDATVRVKSNDGTKFARTLATNTHIIIILRFLIRNGVAYNRVHFWSEENDTYIVHMYRLKALIVKMVEKSLCADGWVPGCLLYTKDIDCDCEIA